MNQSSFYAIILLCWIFPFTAHLKAAHAGNGQPASGIDETGKFFRRRWSHVSENSAVIYWNYDSINVGTTSFVEYGTTMELGMETPRTREPRNAHLHRLNGLETGTTYFYRMVVVKPESGLRDESEILQLTPGSIAGTLYIPGDLAGNPPYTLNQANKRYVLTQDITANGTAFKIEAHGITLDLNGHSVTFGNNTSSQVFGVQITSSNNCSVVNGYIVQGERSADYCNAIRSFSSSSRDLDISGLSLNVSLKNAQPVAVRHPNLKIHHNEIYSSVIDLESRHYPGNALIRVETSGSNIFINDNLLTEGCHRAILVSPSGTMSNVEINHNDIHHHQQYVNGYAIAPGSNAKVHHNRITSTGRGIHLSGADNLVYGNYIDIRGHQHLDDLPAGSRPFYHNLVELHGIKLEGGGSKNNKIYDNFVRIVQLQPVDSLGLGDPVNKRRNGVYFRADASAIEKGKLTDSGQNCETDRWRYYFVKYDPDKPAVRITGNDSITLYGDFEAHDPGGYTVYMIWNYVPPTPLNLSCYDPNAMNEIYNNTFIGITTYAETRHGEYGDSGQWGTGVMLVGMDRGDASEGKYSAYIHNNQFFSNDLYVNSSGSVNMDIRFENNVFNLTNDPLTTNRTTRFRNIGSGLLAELENGTNSFNIVSASEEMVKSSGIRIFPNPACTNLTITGYGENNEIKKITIWSSSGKKLIEPGNAVYLPYRMDVSVLPRGFYIVTVSDGRKSWNEKFFKH